MVQYVPWFMDHGFGSKGVFLCVCVCVSEEIKASIGLSKILFILLLPVVSTAASQLEDPR